MHSNYIGVNRSGTQPLGNGSGGVLIADQAQHTTIGGPARGDGNIISGNNGPGVEVQDPQTYYNVIQGNLIGTDFTGLRPIPNATIGILIDKRSCLTFIGGENPGTGNRIAFNALGGILIADEGTYGNSIFGNSIALNGGLGINLQLPDESNNLPTPNDSGDSDSGPNHGQNFPEITSVNSAAGSTTIQGSLASQADHTYRIDVYQSATLDPSGFGNVVGEYSNGNLIARYTHGLGLESRVDANNTTDYYDFDAIGSTAGLTGGNGSYVNRYSYLPFGEDLNKVEAVSNPFEFVGQFGVFRLQTV